MNEDVESAAQPFRLLLMCTANQCRSPMAERMAARWLAEHAVDAEVTSCGVMEGGVQATRGSVRTLARRGLDLSDHVSRQLSVDTVERADLVLTMERRHLVSIAELSLSAVERSFTLKELAELATTVGPRPAHLVVQEWIAQANAMRLPGTTLTLNTADDVADPMGGSRRDYQRAAAEIEQLLARVLSTAFPAR